MVEVPAPTDTCDTFAGEGSTNGGNFMPPEGISTRLMASAVAGFGAWAIIDARRALWWGDSSTALPKGQAAASSRVDILNCCLR